MRALKNWSLVLLAIAPFASAQVNRIGAVVSAYQSGDFAQAKETSKAIIDSDRPDVTDADRTAARLYHAASILGLGDVESAKSEIKSLLDERPDLTVDAHGFRPEFVTLFNSLRSNLPATATMGSDAASATTPATGATDTKPTDAAQPSTAATAPTAPPTSKVARAPHPRPPPITAPSRKIGYAALAGGGVAAVVGAWTFWRANVLANNEVTGSTPTARDATVAQFTYATVGCFLVAATGLGFGAFVLSENTRLHVSGLLDPSRGSGALSLSGTF